MLTRTRGGAVATSVVHVRWVVVADSSTLGRHAFARICPVERVHVLVTDSAAPESVTAAFTEARVRVLHA